jgi:hypothetical protein
MASIDLIDLKDLSEHQKQLLTGLLGQLDRGTQSEEAAKAGDGEVLDRGRMGAISQADRSPDAPGRLRRGLSPRA